VLSVNYASTKRETRTKPLDRKPSVPLDKILSLVAAGAADADLVSTLASRLARLEQEVNHDQGAAIADAAGGKNLAALSGELLRSIDADEVTQQATEKFEIAGDQEPTEKQASQVEQERMRAALRPFHDPRLRDLILATKRSLEQVIDEQTKDTLIGAGFDAAAKEMAKSMLTSFKQFIDDHKDEIEALKILYSKPYRAGLRYNQVKELAKAIQQPPQSFNPERLWFAYEAVEPDKVKGHGGKQLVDVIALVRHAIDPKTLLAPIGITVEERYQKWLADQTVAGAKFTPEQQEWLDAIKDHIAASLSIERDDLNYVPFNKIGGLGRAYELFGDKLPAILEELNARLAA
jgi:type I restriction enzyme R subunit